MSKSTAPGGTETEEKVCESRFVYVTYIRTTPEKLWEALLQPEFTKKYWSGIWQECDWKKGSSWKMIKPDGEVTDSGTIEEVNKPKRLVIKWQNQFRPELKEEGFSRCTIELAPEGDTVRLTITHEMDRKESKLIDAISNGWPKVICSLKSLLETGESMPENFKWPKC
jgi:uncharacterized protein YndB with AHSA1/START domain